MKLPYLKPCIKDGYKSKTEKRIGDLFEKFEIEFKYEKPTAVVDSGKTKIWYPDFTLSSGIVIEFFGILKNKDYENRTNHKLKIYKLNQIPVIALYPNNFHRWWKIVLLSKILRKLKKLHDDFDSKVAKIEYSSGLLKKSSA